ncbi:MAG TPA: VWA domain-containing protein [Bacteroidales bacterium]|nr:VWA domain-containing protein [Bacteroidales bacterium]HQO08020.1 VWA domain-containing protein [Bacteroidales bacterium]HQP52508.1 VWA domain-containing protein [Bacteroidales bacterium]
MGKNDFTGESPYNFEEKTLCVLLLDTSGSMEAKVGGVKLIDELNQGLQQFYKEIVNDDSVSQQLEISIITFDSDVKTVVEPALVDSFTLPTLKAWGSTNMTDGIREAIDKVNARKEWYKETNQPYKRPWIIMMTDGEPDYQDEIIALANTIKDDMENKKYVFLPMGVENANMSLLTQLAGNVNGKTFGPMKIKGTKFFSFFQWLSASMGTIVKAKEGESVSLAPGSNDPGDWWEAFTI